MAGGAVAVVEPTGISLPQYERMVAAIAQCERVDEAKDIRDKTAALEAYYRQARNLDAERQAANVRLRAERRVGELLKELARAEAGAARNPNGRAGKEPVSADATQVFPCTRCSEPYAIPAFTCFNCGLANDHRPPPSPYAQALADQGMSRQTAHRFQALAEIPEERFERALAAPEKPTTAGMLRHAEARREVRAPPQPKVSDAALTLWGELRDFERAGLFAADCAALYHSMTDAMRADVRRLIPHVRDLLDRLEASYEPA